MKKKLVLVCTAVTLSMSLLCGCGSTSEVQQSASTEVVADITTSVEESTAVTEAPHEHIYTEEVTKEATCLEDGEKTFTCECGDTYTEAIKATGHDFAEYVSNEDATYTADGTETATCSVCGETDTRTAEGSMLTYTFEDMEATKFAKSTVNVRSIPATDGEKLGGLSTNDEVKVTGKCNETGWYRIEYAENVAYVSDSYLVDEKVIVQEPSPETPVNTGDNQTTNNGYNIVYVGDEWAYVDFKAPTYAEARTVANALGYDVFVPHIIDDNTGYFYIIACHSGIHEQAVDTDCNAAMKYMHDNGFPSPQTENITNTRDGRLFINNPADWSIDKWVYHK